MDKSLLYLKLSCYDGHNLHGWFDGDIELHVLSRVQLHDHMNYGKIKCYHGEQWWVAIFAHFVRR